MTHLDSYKIPKFLRSLRAILDSDCDVVQWTRGGTAFEIHDMKQLCSEVLPVHYNHCNYKSFQRQLNYFGFRKWTKTETMTCTFSHRYFVRSNASLAALIVRKRGKTKESVVPLLKPEAGVLHQLWPTAQPKYFEPVPTTRFESTVQPLPIQTAQSFHEPQSSTSLMNYLEYMEVFLHPNTTSQTIVE